MHSDLQVLREYFFKHFSNENISIFKKEGTWQDSKSMVYERFVDYTFDRVVLVSTGGNYNGKFIRD